MKTYTATSSLAKSFTENMESSSSSRPVETADSAVPHSILIVPASRETTGETAARNLAGYLQHEVGFSVLLIDGRLTEMQSGENSADPTGANAGFGEIITGSRDDVAAMLVRDGQNEWKTLPAGAASGRLSHLKIREAYQLILDQVGGRFDYIIIHTLEPEECPVAKALAERVETASICVEDRRTNASALKRSWELMKNHEASNLSVILVKRPPEWIIRLYRKIQDKLPFKLPFEI